jgi:uncharacterized membrane protein
MLWQKMQTCVSDWHIAAEEKHLERQMHNQPMYWLPRAIRILTASGLFLGIVTLSYGYEFGSNEATVLIFFTSVILWFLGVVGGLTLAAYRNKHASLQSNPAKWKQVQKSRRLLWVGLVLTALPIGWYYVLSTVFHVARDAQPILVHGPPLIAVFTGIVIGVYSQVLAWKASLTGPLL